MNASAFTLAHAFTSPIERRVLCVDARRTTSRMRTVHCACTAHQHGACAMRAGPEYLAQGCHSWVSPNKALSLVLTRRVKRCVSACVKSSLATLEAFGVFTLGDARSFSGLTSTIPPLGSMLKFDAGVKKRKRPRVTNVKTAIGSLHTPMGELRWMLCSVY